MILVDLRTPPVEPGLQEAAARAGYTIVPSMAAGYYDLVRKDGGIGCVGVTLETIQAAAESW